MNKIVFAIILILNCLRVSAQDADSSYNMIMNRVFIINESFEVDNFSLQYGINICSFGAGIHLLKLNKNDIFDSLQVAMISNLVRSFSDSLSTIGNYVFFIPIYNGDDGYMYLSSKYSEKFSHKHINFVFIPCMEKYEIKILSTVFMDINNRILIRLMYEGVRINRIKRIINRYFGNFYSYTY